MQAGETQLVGELAGILPHMDAKDSHSNLVICMYYSTDYYMNVGVCYGPSRTNTVPASRQEFFGMVSGKVEILSQCTRWLSVLPPHIPRPFWLPPFASLWHDMGTDEFQLNTMAGSSYLRPGFGQGGADEELIGYLQTQVNMFCEWMDLVDCTTRRYNQPRLWPYPPFGGTDVSQLP